MQSSFPQRNYNYEELERSLLNREQADSRDLQKEKKLEPKTENKAKKISVEELQSMMAENPQFQKEIASLLEKMSGEGMQP